MSSSNVLPKKFLLVVFFLIFVLAKTSFAQEYNPNEVVVKMLPSFSSEERLKFHREAGGQVAEQIQNLGVDVLRFEGIDINRIIERLKFDPRVLYAEPNYVATAFEMTNDPALVQNLQWGLLKINAGGSSESAWNISKGKTSVVVAVLDTGIAQNHEDLGSKIIASKNCTDSKTTDDLYGHGTHVAGIVSANTNNNAGVAGSGYNISLINAKGLGDTGSGYYSWLANCLVWAADSGARVINMSLGGSSDSKLLSDAIEYAWNKGVVLVAAAGNSGSNSPSFPAYYPHVLSVAATDQNDGKATFSNYGSWVDVAAPGVNIYSTLPTTPNAFKQTGYGYGSGTSMASPFAAGLAGLLFSMGSPDNNNVVKLIEGNADKIAGTGSNWIYGRINAYKSLLAASVTGSESTVVTPTLAPTLIPTSTPTPTPTATLTPTPVPTLIPTPTSIPDPTFTPAPTAPAKSSYPSGKSPWSRLCSRFPSFCH